MISRRQFLSLALPLLSLSSAQPARAALRQIGPQNPWGIPMEAWIPHPVVVKQQCAQWCWAASMSMVFAHHGHPIDQQLIVNTAFGGTVCAPAPAGAFIAAGLSRPWTDKNGNVFNSTVSGVFDVAAGVATLNNVAIVNELANDRPLIYCNTHHAMVLVAVEYLDTPMGPYITAATVLDPWPYSPNWHALSKAELFPAISTPFGPGGQMMFMASVDIAQLTRDVRVIELLADVLANHSGQAIRRFQGKLPLE